MTDTWQKLGDITQRITDRLAPVVINVELNGPIAEALCKYAEEMGVDSSTIIAEAVRSYLGDAA